MKHKSDHPETTARWELQTVGTGSSGRGDIAARDLKDALAEGWEPFAVAEGRIWFRRLAHA